MYILPLTHLCKLSFLYGVFPSELKVAKVIPLYKSDDKMLINNYRPVSILPVFSKVFEKLMYSRLISFIDKYKTLYKYQFGFRAKHSTNMALILLIDKISNALNNGDVACGVFLDFSKAFDTVNHDILLDKLCNYGIRGICLKWIKDYLCNREQYVSYDNTCSEKCKILCGVPQGSILGPLMFLLYINDLSSVSKIVFTILFADDTSVFVTGKNIDNLIETMNNELEKLVEWLYINKLSLNIKKTQFMIFTLRKSNANSIPIKLNNKVIEKVESVKFLGVHIDSKLSWNNHLNYVRSKISKGIGILCKARKVFNRSTLLTMYYSFLYPYFIYGIEVWGSAAHCFISSVIKLQKRAVKIITSTNFRSPSQPLFNQLKILPLNKIYEYCIILFMFKYVNNLLPHLFESIFVFNLNVHSYETRQSRKLHVPKGNISLLYRTIKHKGTYLWNFVYDKISYSCGISFYKKCLKTFLLENDIPTTSTRFI